MRLQASLNGPREPGEHRGVPISAVELARDGAACAALGVTSLHVHPRDEDGAECLDPAVVDAVVSEVRAAARVPVGVTSAAWIEPGPGRRVALLAGWSAPDFATVNLCEDGAAEAMRALLERDIGIEAGLWEAADAERLVGSGLAGRSAATPSSWPRRWRSTDRRQ
jgi:uncharacterized protein (DUF849 family)